MVFLKETALISLRLWAFVHVGTLMFGLSYVNTWIFTFLIKLDTITFLGVDIQVFPQFIKILDILVSRRNVLKLPGSMI